MSKNPLPQVRSRAGCSMAQCTMRLALKKHVSIRIGQNDDLGSHFLMSELFQMKIFGSFLLCSFTFNLYLGTSWKQPAAEVENALESIAIQPGCGKVLKELRGPVEQSPLNQSPNIFTDPSCENIWEIFAPRRAARIKKLFSSFFKSRIWLLCIPNFKFIWPALHVFCKYMNKGQKYLLKQIFV